MKHSRGQEDDTGFWGKPGDLSEAPGCGGLTGQPSPKGAVAVAVEECTSVASQFCLSRGAGNTYFL